MFLVEKHSGDLLRVNDLDALFNPIETEVLARDQMGEEELDLMPMAKDRLVFPSGESLPRCWVDVDYRNAMRKQSEFVER